jgi:hypothetical protein
MTCYVALGQDPHSSSAVAACLQPLGVRADGVTSITVPDRNVRRDAIADTLEDVASLLDAIALRNLERASPRPIVVLVDAVSPAGMDLISDAGGWNQFIALLVVTFPDIWWVFGSCTGNVEGFPQRDHSLASFYSDAARNPLFDPTGLRDWVRQRTNRHLHESGFEIQLPTRKGRAAAIDEERGYAFMHAYTAYRFGYRTEAVQSWANMAATFGPFPRHDPTEGHGYDILLEDMSLNFPDWGARGSLLTLADRGIVLPYLDSAAAEREDSRYRILVTAGQEGLADDALALNRAYLDNKACGQGRIAFKPLGGIVELWREAKQMRAVVSGERQGNAPGFEWPPRYPATADAKGHGAPGRLGLVSELLLRRALTAQREAKFVQDFLTAAVVAGDAAELVGAVTPTLAFSAITARHELEVQAECVFGAAGLGLSVKERAAEIASEVGRISELFREDGRPRVVAATRSVILNRLAIIFRERGHFKEEMSMLAALRGQERKRGGWVSWGVGSYIEALVASPGVFLLAIVGWLLVLGLIWHLINGQAGAAATLSGVISGFFGGNAAAKEESVGLILWSGLAAALGILHLGILLSHLYALVIRR